jgi:hypothetical protein
MKLLTNAINSPSSPYAVCPRREDLDITRVIREHNDGGKGERNREQDREYHDPKMLHESHNNLTAARQEKLVDRV